MQQQMRELEQQIAASLQERREYFARINAIRPIRLNPAFGGREPRRLGQWTRALVAVERQLDALYARLRSLQAELQTQQPPTPPAARQQAQSAFDNQGHDASYWQQRGQEVRDRIQTARLQRQAILEQLLPESGDMRRTTGIGGREMLTQIQTLQQIDQTMQEAEDALQTLRQEADRAGAPAEWLQ
jgi:hypothetical protein